MPPRFTFVDLFAGIGGTRLAFQQEGGHCVFSSEWDRPACRTYFENFGEHPEGDITKIDAFDIPQHDVLVAGFPCQPFSIAGVTKHRALGNKDGFEHPTQGTLFFEVVRILKESRPRAFFLENVKNLVTHDRGTTFNVILATLRDELGYDVHHAILDAQRIVPQHRERVYIVGFRRPTQFTFPQLCASSTAVADILEPRAHRKYTLTRHLWQYLQEYALKHRAKGNGFGYCLVDVNGASRTLSARYYKDGSEILIPQAGKPPRRLTPRECARLMGFPDSFAIPVSDTQAYKQFGNSVVVPLANAVARELVKCLTHDRRTATAIYKPMQTKLHGFSDRRVRYRADSLNGADATGRITRGANRKTTGSRS